MLVFGNPKNRLMNDPDLDYSIGLEFFKSLGDFAAEHDTCICIEPNPTDYGTNFINTLFEANRLVNEVKSSGFSMIIDSSTMILNNDSPCDILSVIDNTKHIHISMPFLKPFNTEYANYKDWIYEFIKTIRNSSYNNFVSIEMANASLSDISKSLAILSEIAST